MMQVRKVLAPIKPDPDFTEKYGEDITLHVYHTGSESLHMDVIDHRIENPEAQTIFEFEYVGYLGMGITYSHANCVELALNFLSLNPGLEENDLRANMEDEFFKDESETQIRWRVENTYRLQEWHAAFCEENGIED